MRGYKVLTAKEQRRFTVGSVHDVDTVDFRHGITYCTNPEALIKFGDWTRNRELQIVECRVVPSGREGTLAYASRLEVVRIVPHAEMRGLCTGAWTFEDGSMRRYEGGKLLCIVYPPGALDTFYQLYPEQRDPDYTSGTSWCVHYNPDGTPVKGSSIWI